jgi:hypothetical protein
MIIEVRLQKSQKHKPRKKKLPHQESNLESSGSNRKWLRNRSQTP